MVREPKTKADLLNKMVAQDFSGDIRDLAPARDLKISRLRPNALRLTFPSGSTFDLVVHKPRELSTTAAPKATRAQVMASQDGQKRGAGKRPKHKARGQPS